MISDGMTISSAFDLKWGAEYRGLSDQNLAQYRHNLSELKMIIIDEISLVSPDMIYQISMRMCDIFQCKLPFGGKAAFTVGDTLQVNTIISKSIHDSYYKIFLFSNFS